MQLGNGRAKLKPESLASQVPTISHIPFGPTNHVERRAMLLLLSFITLLFVYSLNIKNQVPTSSFTENLLNHFHLQDTM